MFSMHRRETLKNIRAMGMRLSFAVRNNKQTFFHLDILLSHSSQALSFDQRLQCIGAEKCFFLSKFKIEVGICGQPTDCQNVPLIQNKLQGAR